MADDRADIAKAMDDLARADEILAGVRSNPAAVARIAQLARLATKRALADNNNNCICTGGGSRGELVE